MIVAVVVAKVATHSIVERMKRRIANVDAEKSRILNELKVARSKKSVVTANLKKLLLSINISTAGCAERADLVDLAEKHRSALEHTRTVSAAAPTTSSSSSFHVPHRGVADGAHGDSTDSAVDRLRQQGEAAGKGGGGIVDSPQAQRQLAAERRELLLAREPISDVAAD